MVSLQRRLTSPKVHIIQNGTVRSGDMSHIPEILDYWIHESKKIIDVFIFEKFDKPEV